MQPVNPFESMDIRTLLDTQAAGRGEHPFLIWEPLAGKAQRWSYSAFVDRVRRFAAGLCQRGVIAGDRIIVHLDNCPEGLIAWLGCAYSGAVPVTTNSKATPDDLAYFAQHSGAVAVITQPRFAEMVAAATPNVSWRAVTEGIDAGIAELTPDGYVPFSEIDGLPEQLPLRLHDPMAPFGIQYTSGTTARPKAVLWSHGNALWGGMKSAQHEELGPEDVHLTYLPLCNTNAQVYSVLASLWAGATVVLMPRFSASRFWPVSLRHKATWTSLVPFCMKALLNQPVPERHFYRRWGNAVCAPPFDQHFGVTTTGWWGMTETVTHGIVGGSLSANAPMSLGRPAAGYEIFVLDDDGKPVSLGEVGDLFVGGIRGVSLFLEYAGDPAATAAAFRPDGLFITGDRIKLGTDGCLYFADRTKDMLKVGGENVAASEIEAVIFAVEGVAEVAVVSMPHPMFDEVPAAFVLAAEACPEGLLERITDACAVGLADFKIPKLIRIVDTLPRATLEKVAKAELREQLLAELESEADALPS
jgi:carnitine-CoA ligase